MEILYKNDVVVEMPSQTPQALLEATKAQYETKVDDEGVETFTETNISDWTFVPSAADKNANAITYLASTDWYASRLAENGTAIPADVLEKREAARAAIVD